MNTDANMSKNKGEWSELYTFCYLLNAGILKTADRNLNPISSAYLPIIKILRKEDDVDKSYSPKSENKCVEIFINNEFKKSVPMKIFEDTVSTIYDSMKNESLKDADFQIKMQKFMGEIFCTKIKANSSKKEDIVIQIHDINTNQTPIQGFSIKSYIGNTPTLLNAAKTTNFIFKVKGCNESIMDFVNSIKTKKKIFDRMDYLMKSGCVFEYVSMECECFKKNLQKVDSLMPNIVAEMLLKHYSTGIEKLSSIAAMLEKEDPLRMSNEDYYTYKIKMMLCAFALGMIPSNQWNGKEDANGGYIVVKENGDVVCFFLYNRNEFEEYLLNSTKFERPSTGRHEYMTVYKDNNDYFIKLNLQIRFM